MIMQIARGGVVERAIVVGAGLAIAPDRLSATWAGGAWAAEDGETAWSVDGADLGWRVDGDMLAPPPAPSLGLQEAQAVAVAAIVAQRAARLAAGAPVGAVRIALDDGSRADLGSLATTALAAASGAAAWPESYQIGWIALDNSRVPLPAPADGLALAAAAGDYYARVVQRARTLKDLVLAADNAAALAAIDLASGWPE